MNFCHFSNVEYELLVPDTKNFLPSKIWLMDYGKFSGGAPYLSVTSPLLYSYMLYKEGTPDCS